MVSLPGPTRSFTNNIVHASDTCLSLALNDKSASQANLQTSATGNVSYMNCVGVGITFLTYNFKVNRHFLTRLTEAIQEFGSQLKDIPLTPGGTAMDIARIAQWLLPQPKTVAFLGARASDEHTHTLKELCRQTRVAVRMEEVANSRTPVLLVAHYKRKWCEMLFIDNKATINTTFIDKPFVTSMLERANMVFITELSVLMNPRMSQMLAYFSFSRFKHCLLFLHSDQFLLDVKDSVQEILTYVDIVIVTPKCCNGSRYAWDIYSWVKGLSKKSSIVIVTDGLKTAYVHTDLNTGMSVRYKSRFARRTKVVDYYGIESAFVAGFMAMMIRGHQLDPCVECGFYCASVIVRKCGVRLPDEEGTVNEWYLLLERILQRKTGGQHMGKRESGLPFTMFQTPWKEGDVDAVFGVCMLVFVEGSVSLTC